MFTRNVPDLIGSVQGYFCAVEAKLWRKDTTMPRLTIAQLDQLRRIHETGAIVGAAVYQEQNRSWLLFFTGDARANIIITEFLISVHIRETPIFLNNFDEFRRAVGPIENPIKYSRQ